MNLKSKFVLKKLGLAVVVLGLAAGAGVGISNLVQNLKDDTQKVALNFEVGGLNETTGKYEEVKDTLYTKERFACEGLTAKLDFDATINYQIFYYDILDNYLSASNVLNKGYSNIAPLNGAYARIEITPTNDEDNKISLTEKYKYSNMLTVRVNKHAEDNVEEKFTSYKGKCLQVVDLVTDSVFEIGTALDNKNFDWQKGGDTAAATTKTLLSVGDKNRIKFDFSKFTIADGDSMSTIIYGFDNLPTKNGKVIETYTFLSSGSTEPQTIGKNVKYLIVSTWCQPKTGSTFKFDSTMISKLPGSILLSKAEA